MVDLLGDPVNALPKIHSLTDCTLVADGGTFTAVGPSAGRVDPAEALGLPAGPEGPLAAIGRLLGGSGNRHELSQPGPHPGLMNITTAPVPEETATDRFFLAHADQLAHRELSTASIAIRNLAEAFATLAERTAIPVDHRSRYRLLGTSFQVLVDAIREADACREVALGSKAREPIPPPAAAEMQGGSLNEAAVRVGAALAAAEGKAREFLGRIAPELTRTPWAGTMDHAQASWSLLLDPGPAFPQYLLEDSDFNLFEAPFAAIDFPDEPPEVAGRWLHEILTGSCLGLEGLSMVRTVYVDFDLGTGLVVSGLQETTA